MSHSHDHHPVRYDRAFAIGISLNMGFVIIEAGFGLWSNSLALIADAGHNFSDVIGLVLAWGAAWLSRRPPTARRTFGWRRSSILAALLNAILLLVAVGGICWESVARLRHPEPASESVVIWVAVVGILINGLTAWMFFSGRGHDANIRGAFLHMAADAGVSFGVVIAAIVMQQTQWLWIDPAISLLIAGVIVIGTWGLLRESLNLSLDAVPIGIDVSQVRMYLLSLPGVADVHDLHIWAISTTETSVMAHLVVENARGANELLRTAAGELHSRFGLEHITLQIEQSEAGIVNCPTTNCPSN